MNIILAVHNTICGLVSRSLDSENCANFNLDPLLEFLNNNIFLKVPHLFGSDIFSVSSVVEFQRWWVLKSKVFAQESNFDTNYFELLIKSPVVCKNQSF